MAGGHRPPSVQGVYLGNIYTVSLFTDYPHYIGQISLSIYFLELLGTQPVHLR